MFVLSLAYLGENSRSCRSLVVTGISAARCSRTNYFTRRAFLQNSPLNTVDLSTARPPVLGTVLLTFP